MEGGAPSSQAASKEELRETASEGGKEYLHRPPDPCALTSALALGPLKCLNDTNESRLHAWKKLVVRGDLIVPLAYCSFLK